MSKQATFSTVKIFRFVLMILVLGILGSVFGVIGALIGGKLLGDPSFGFGALGLAIGGIFIGYPAGIIVGIILIKRVFHQSGSLLLGIIGSIVGALVVIILAEPLNLNSNANLLFGSLLLSAPLFCLIGFYLKR